MSFQLIMQVPEKCCGVLRWLMLFGAMAVDILKIRTIAKLFDIFQVEKDLNGIFVFNRNVDKYIALL